MTAVDAAREPALPDRRLLQLQALDTARDRLGARQAELESAEDLRRATHLVRELERQVGEVKLSLDDAATEQRRLEGDVDAMGRKAEAERQRLYDGSVANAKELQSIEAEIANIRNRIATKEDAVLEVMERREDLEARLRAVESELADARARLAEVERAGGRELEDVRASLAATTTERETLAGRIDPDLLELYDDLRRQKKGVAAVELVDGVCQGCHQKLSPVYLERLKHTDGIRRCEYCRRIIVS